MKRLFICIILFTAVTLEAQPWKHPLKICSGSDGVNFSNTQTFQDSSGVPSLIRLPNGNLACAFQWFRQPLGSPSWDRVAIKFSSNNGMNWSEPVPIVVNNLPQNFTRPFDPTLAISNDNRIRIYFSDGLNFILDTSINTYSAISDDGIHYEMESGTRFSISDKPVIDPAAIRFRNLWHLVNPWTIVSSQGAYHNVSADGLNFNRVTDIVSDQQHNWTGNYMINEDTTELRFYGSGMMVWYASSPNGGQWSSFVNTNINGGDPSVLKLSADNYMMIYVGQEYPVSVSADIETADVFSLKQNYPNPFNPSTHFEFSIPEREFVTVKIYSLIGLEIATLINEVKQAGKYEVTFDGSNLSGGVYYYRLTAGNYSDTKKMMLLK
ncbi:MAG: T9SS type A sorting domain-containing protein [bacterium]